MTQNSPSVSYRVRMFMLSIFIVSAFPLDSALAWECGGDDNSKQKNLLTEVTGFAKISNTTGGMGKKVIRFSSIEDTRDGKIVRGTMRAAIEEAKTLGGGWIEPDAGIPENARIVLSSPLRVPSNVTLDGGCKMISLVGPVIGSTLEILGSSNVIINHWNISMPNSDIYSGKAGDCISIGRGADRVLIVYNSFGRCGDGVIDVTQSRTLSSATRVTISSNRFDPHDKVMLVGTLDCGQRVPTPGVQCPAALSREWNWNSGVQVTLARNHFRSTGQRHPRMTGQAYLHWLDNVVEFQPFLRESGGVGASYGALVGGGARIFLQGGFFVALDSSHIQGAAVKKSTARSPEGPGAIRIDGTVGLGGAILLPHHSELVPDPPYNMIRRRSEASQIKLCAGHVQNHRFCAE